MAKNTGTTSKKNKNNKDKQQYSIETVAESKKQIILNPYQYFYDRYISSDEFEVNIDEYKVVEPDVKFILQAIKDQISEARVSKNKWLAQAMEQDPAFMLNPVEDYYKKLIPADILESLSETEIMDIISIYDPVTWGEKNLLQNYGGWKPRTSRKGFPYQAQLIRCNSKRIVARAGRRLGKSASLVVRILHKAFTWYSKSRPTYRIVIFTPNQAQIEVIFKMMEMFIDNNPDLLSIVKDGKIPTRKNPNYTLELTNGVHIIGFVSGSTAVRGSAADMLILDEASFLTKDDTDAVLALLTEHENVELWISSTPKGLKDYFYDRVHDASFVSFHFPSNKYHPNWTYQMEQEFRNQLSSSGYAHEVEAAFSSDGEGVFQMPFINASIKDYTYDHMVRSQNWKYVIGVDWNDPKNGTQIYVVGFDPSEMKYTVVDRASVHIEKWTQTIAVKLIAEMNRKWRASAIYVDKGYGGVQLELLHEIGAKAAPNTPDKKLLFAKGVGFAEVIEMRDPWSTERQIVKRQTKAFLVNNAVRVFESLNINIPSEDKMLIHQLQGYRIDRFTPAGLPVYASDPQYGDHCLDAMMIALFGFVMEYNPLAKPSMAQSIKHVNINYKHDVDPTDNIQKAALEAAIKLNKDKEAEERIRTSQMPNSALNIYDSSSIQRRGSANLKQMGKFGRRPIPRRNNF